MTPIKLPSALSVVLGAVAGVAVAFVASGIIVVEGEWKTYLETGLTVLAGLGIAPLTGPAFQAMIHLSHAAALAISGVLGTLVVILAQVHMSAGLHGLLAGIVAFGAGLGFGPAFGGSVGTARTP